MLGKFIRNFFFSLSAFSSFLLIEMQIVSACSQSWASAALAKAYRFVADPRDDADESRLAMLNEAGGMWDCTRCMQCVEVCPKDVAPMDRIMELRDRAMNHGFMAVSYTHLPLPTILLV